MWTDTHAHLDKLKIGAEKAIEQAKENSVNRIITIGTEPSDWLQVLELIKYKNVYGTLGMHPHEAKDFTDEHLLFLKNQLASPKIIAVGEIGLDYYYKHSDSEQQKKVFYKQMCLAEEHGLPVQIHTRHAEEDTLMYLKEFKGRVKGLLHCFTSSEKLAEGALDCGFNISFSGIITFKNSDELRRTCQSVPIERMHIETDSPFLAPVPHRGQENQPAWVDHVATCICELHKVTKQDLSAQLEKNTLNLFSRIGKAQEECLN